MNRKAFLELLAAHQPENEIESSMKDAMTAFVERNENFFSRSLGEGHLTGAAWIVDVRRGAVVLLHHAKLDKWLQPGGHVEGDEEIQATALREALEETGLNGIRPIGDRIFDIDIHSIPARKEEPAHFHYDVRFLFEGDSSIEPIQSSESRLVQWVPLERLEDFTTEESVLRLARRYRSLSK